ncbi:helicase-related protein [Salipiger marinus]|uniref:helicase-related protein n=1 Tax=Salipiger marinus TaxID=555512 RepID=UPI004059EE95
MRLDQNGDDETGVNRTGLVRTAFNSPFKPFVLASTSVGQEGLDFHPYCHRIFHWKLPGKPVDMEQREGRVHRYKNHAVRLNLGSGPIDLLEVAKPA